MPVLDESPRCLETKESIRPASDSLSGSESPCCRVNNGIGWPMFWHWKWHECRASAISPSISHAIQSRKCNRDFQTLFPSFRTTQLNATAVTLLRAQLTFEPIWQLHQLSNKRMPIRSAALSRFDSLFFDFAFFRVCHIRNNNIKIATFH